MLFRNSIRDVKTLPGANIDSDHILHITEGQTTLKATEKAGKRKQKCKPRVKKIMLKK